MTTHGYKPRKVTADRLSTSKMWLTHEKPCDVCGGSKTLNVHDVSNAFPRKFASRWSDDLVWLGSLPKLAL